MQNNLIKEIYLKLSEKVLKEVDIKTEFVDFIDCNILDMEYKILLEIKDNKLFLIEAYFKILDRPIDEKSLIHYLSMLDKTKISKTEIIGKLLNSAERKNKFKSVLGQK